jgi:hypothetical protein
MSRNKALTQFCGLHKSESSTGVSKTISLHAAALASLQEIDVSDQLKYRIESELDALLDAHLGVCRTTDLDFNAIKAHLDSKPGLMQYYARREQAAAKLSALLDQISYTKVHPDGYTPFELMRVANIKKDLWQTICRRASIQIDRGDSHRRFKNYEIRKLISAAREHGKRKGHSAADAWEALLERNRQNLDL